VLRLSTPRRNEIAVGLALWRWLMVVCCERLQLLDVESRGGVTAAGRRTGEDARVDQRDGGEVKVFE
jgi:hypothetical protein